MYESGTLQFQGKEPGKTELTTGIEAAISNQRTNRVMTPISVSTALQPEDKKKVFIVYGHDDAAREQLELVIMKLGLDPFVLANTSGSGLTIIESLEKEIVTGNNRCSFGIVLLTPDDMGYSKAAGPSRIEPRARQNVVLEMGMLLSAVGRSNVVILKKGHIEAPSDTGGIIYLAFNDHVKETVPRLVERLKSSGFDIKPENITKASS